MVTIEADAGKGRLTPSSREIDRTAANVWVECSPMMVPGTADRDCGEIQWRRFTVRWDVPNPDPHRFDGDGDGMGCES